MSGDGARGDRTGHHHDHLPAHGQQRVERHEEEHGDHAVIRDRMREGVGYRGCASGLAEVRSRGPVANQAKTKAPSATTSAAMPCFTWWCPYSELFAPTWPGKKDGSECAGS